MLVIRARRWGYRDRVGFRQDHASTSVVLTVRLVMGVPEHVRCSDEAKRVSEHVHRDYLNVRACKVKL